jgi:hypothetical protein
VPGAGPQVPVDRPGRRVVDAHDPVPAALAPDVDLALVQVQVAAAGVARVIADPGQLGQPDPGRPEHREDRRVPPLCERVAPARLIQLGKFCAGEERHRLVRHLRRAEPCHRVGDLVLGRQPAEELLECTVLLVGVGLAVAAQQPHHPPLHVLSSYLRPAGLTCLAQQVGGGEPARCLGVDPDRPGRLVLRRQVQLERGHVRRERPRVQRSRARQPERPRGQSFTLVPQF